MNLDQQIQTIINIRKQMKIMIIATTRHGRLYSFKDEQEAWNFSRKFNGHNPHEYMPGIFRVLI